MPWDGVPRRGGGGSKHERAQADFRARLNAMKARMGITDTTIPVGMTFREWCEDLGQRGMKVDGKPFRLDNRPAMAWIYDQIPSTVDEAYNLVLVLMKCAQVGFTVMEMLACIYLGLRFGPAIVGMFLPDINLAGTKSTERFMPVVRSIPHVHKLMTQDAPDGSGRRQGEGNVNRRRIDQALFVFSWTSGRSSTESVPMDVVSYDEVQEMTLAQMEKTQERLSGSELRFSLMGSTANWPDSDIHHWYKRGTQHQFHTECPTCGTAKPLDDYFPKCIKWDEGRQIYRYVCPNGHWITDTQRGRWIAQHPELDPPVDVTVPKLDRPLRIRSIHFPQFLSPTISAGDILFAYNTATDMANFYRRKLGKPYLDPSQVPVTLEHCNAAAKAGMAAGVVWKDRSSGAFMGIDQMGNYNVVVIKERMADGRQAVIHAEEIFSADPFKRCSTLMKQYSVQACVVEINPNYNDAKKFANKHKGRVWICDSFGALEQDMIQWGDTPKMDASDRRTDEEARDRYTLKMDQYKCMQVSMARITGGACLFADPKGLVQEIDEKGVTQTVEVAARMFHHFTKTALVAEKNEKSGTNKYVRRVKKVGIDPHYSYANMLCDVAWARAYGTTTFILPSATDVMEATKEARSRAETADLLQAQGLPAELAAALATPAQPGTCGACSHFDGQGQCNLRGLITGARERACVMFSEPEPDD